jgi:TetR/AcrR family transcriptional regulator
VVRSTTGPVRRPVGRPRRVPAVGTQDPRDAILESAAHLFSSVGYPDTTTRQIAARVGVTQSSLYNHFARKEDILAVLLERALDGILAIWTWMADSTPECDVALWTLVCHDVETVCSGPLDVGPLLRLPVVTTARFELHWEKRRQLEELYHRFVSEGLAAGTFVGGDPMIATHLVFSLTEGTFVWFERTEETPPALAARSVADAALRMLLTRRDRLRGIATKGEDLLLRYRRAATTLSPPADGPA